MFKKIKNWFKGFDTYTSDRAYTSFSTPYVMIIKEGEYFCIEVGAFFWCAAIEWGK